MQGEMAVQRTPGECVSAHCTVGTTSTHMRQPEMLFAMHVLKSQREDIPSLIHWLVSNERWHSAVFMAVAFIKRVLN